MNIFTIIDTLIAALEISAIAIAVLGIIACALAHAPKTATAPTMEQLQEISDELEVKLFAPVPEPAPVVTTTTEKPATAPTLSNLIKEHYRPAKIAQKAQPATVIEAFTIRELRAYIRANSLQEQVKLATGKNVSKCTKSELLGAIA